MFDIKKNGKKRKSVVKIIRKKTILIKWYDPQRIVVVKRGLDDGWYSLFFCNILVLGKYTVQWNIAIFNFKLQCPKKGKFCVPEILKHVTLPNI